MSVNCMEIVRFMETLAPKELAEKWDNVGLLLGSFNKEIKRVMVCLDATTKVVSDAASGNVDMLISHHPLIFKSINRINTDEVMGRIIETLIKKDICLYSSHTNLDFAQEGVNHYLAETLGLAEIRSPDAAVNESGNNDAGIYGLIEKRLNLDAFISMLKKNLKIKKIRQVGTIEGDIKKVAVFCGSFNGNYSALVANNIDVIVTGELKYHTAVELIENGLCAIDAGHFNTERLFVGKLAQLLENEFKTLDIICNEVENDPFIIR